MCMQRKAEKCVPQEIDFIKSNINSFGDDIGKTTNWITSMFDVQAKFKKGSKEYDTLAYRICCGQHYQQNSIDRSKGIICKPMPGYWHERHYVKTEFGDSNEAKFQYSILADKKPYFMRYIYPNLAAEYNKYIKNTNQKAICSFNMTVQQLIDLDKRTEQQQNFIDYYYKMLPLSDNNCVMNRICRRFEEEFDHYSLKYDADKYFDYSVMKSDVEYTAYYSSNIKKIYTECCKRFIEQTKITKNQRTNVTNLQNSLQNQRLLFKRECAAKCSDAKMLCNVLLDIGYKREGTKQLVWDECGDIIIENLLEKNNYMVSFPVRDFNGDVSYKGERFSFVKVKMEGDAE